MQFLKTFSIAALAASVLAQESATGVVNSINDITDYSAVTNTVAQSISFTNFFTTAPQLINDFRQIISLATDEVTAIGGGNAKRDVLPAADAEKRSVEKRQASPPYSEENQLAICQAFSEFVTVHQRLLRTVIGKQGILAQTPFTVPIAQVLAALEGGVDTLAFSIIDVVPTCAGETTQRNNELDQTLQQAVNTYS